MAYNYTHRADSSGSDDDYGYDGARVREMHHHSRCRYNQFRTELGGRRVYVWLRSCFCGQYRSYDIRGAVTDTEVDLEDGKDVHLSAECRWRRVKKDGGWELSKKCLNCGSPLSASYTGNSQGVCCPS